MRRHSLKRARQERNLRKIEKKMRESGDYDKCFFYPYKHASSFDHCVPKAHNQKLIDCKENLVPICGEAHFIIDQGITKQIKELPNLDKYLERMSKLDYSYYSRFMTNHELW